MRDDFAFGRVELRKVQLALSMQLGHRQKVLLAKQGQFPRAKLDVADGQAILIASGMRLSLQQFRRRIGIRAHRRGGLAKSLDGPGQAKIADLHGVADDQEVLGLDISVDNGYGRRSPGREPAR